MNVLSALSRRTLPVIAAALIFSLNAPAIIAQGPSPTWSQDDTLRIAKEVQKRLPGLTDYSVFDWITFGIHGKSIVFKGYASRPTLKSDAARASRAFQESNRSTTRSRSSQILDSDDRLRAAVYNHIYTQSACGDITRTRAVSRKRWDPVQRRIHGRWHHQ